MGWVRKPTNARLIQAARCARVAEELAHMDYLRAVRKGVKEMNQTQVAEELGISQPAISQTLKTATDVKDIPEGFSGADCVEIVKRYIAGGITRPRLIDELNNFADKSGDRTCIDKAFDNIIAHKLYDPAKAERLRELVKQ